MYPVVQLLAVPKMREWGFARSDMLLPCPILPPGEDSPSFRIREIYLALDPGCYGLIAWVDAFLAHHFHHV